MGWQDPEFQKGWNAVFNEYLATLQERIDAVGVPIFGGDPEELSPKATSQASRRETLLLARDAIAHLKDGGQNGAPGLLSTALGEISLRNSAAARTIGVKKPVYETEADPTTFDNGSLAAISQIENLVIAAEQDMKVSARRVFQAIDKINKPLHVKEDADALDDPEMKKIADAITQDVPLTPGQLQRLTGEFNGAAEDPGAKALKKQAAFSAQATVNMYRHLLSEMKTDIEALQKKHAPGVVRAVQVAKPKKGGPTP